MNRRERVLAAFHNETPDRTPCCFCYHGSAAASAAELAGRQLELFQRSGMDLLKIMYDLTYSAASPITSPKAWRRLALPGRGSSYYRKQLDIIKRILDETGGTCVVLDTTFSPMRHLVWMLDNSNARMMEHLQEDPEAVCCGLSAIAEEMAQWIDGFLEAGVDGIFYAAQFGELERFTREAWERFVMPYDEIVLRAVRQHPGKLILLHPCGQPQYQCRVDLARYRDYDKDMVNWSVHANKVSMEEGRSLFQCPVMGGVDNRGAIASGDRQALRQEIWNILDGTRGAGFLLGADCSLPGNPDWEILRYVVDVVEEYHQRRRR